MPILNTHHSHRHLLTHTVGLPYDIANPLTAQWAEHMGRTVTNLSWTQGGFTTPLLFAPGDGWVYGSAMDWAGLAAERATGCSLGRLMKTFVFDRAGMECTGFSPQELVHEGRLAEENRCDRADGDGWVQREPEAETKVEDDVVERDEISSIDNTGDRRSGNDKGPDIHNRSCSGSQPRFRGRRSGSGLGKGIFPIRCDVEEREMDSGGAGLFGTAEDFGRFLHALLAGRLLGLETVRNALLCPQLADDRQVRQLSDTVYGNLAAFGPEFVTDDGHRVALNFGMGSGVVNMEDLEGRRRKRSVTWSGMANSRWVRASQAYYLLLPRFIQ